MSNKNIKILAESSVPYLKGVIEELGDATYLRSDQFTPEVVKDKDWLIIRSVTKCTPQLLEGSNVRLITSATIGFDHIDIDYCANNNIEWHNAPGCNAEAVGQYFGSVLSTLMIGDGWDPHGKTLGIVGVGHVGTIVMRYAKAFGLNVLLNDPPRADKEGEEGFVSLDEIARRCDMITFYTPLTKQGKYATYHLCDEAFLSKCERRPIIMNACRGAVADNKALLQAKREGKVQALILDCWENEPTIDQELMEEVAIATPHIAGFSADGKANGARTCVQHGLRFFGVESTHMDLIMPKAPENPIIDGNKLERPLLPNAMLHTYDPMKVDKLLREHPEQFEEQRRSYNFPREPFAYKVINIPDEEKEAFELIGFQCG